MWIIWEETYLCFFLYIENCNYNGFRQLFTDDVFKIFEVHRNKTKVFSFERPYTSLRFFENHILIGQILFIISFFELSNVCKPKKNRLKHSTFRPKMFFHLEPKTEIFFFEIKELFLNLFKSFIHLWKSWIDQLE